jgi:hypothetical protein
MIMHSKAREIRALSDDEVDAVSGGRNNDYRGEWSMGSAMLFGGFIGTAICGVVAFLEELFS